MLRRLRIACCCLVLGLTAAAATADQIDLANGDRLTGTVLRKEADHLVLQTPYAGEIRINWSQVVRVQTDEPMSLVLADQSLAESRSIGAPATHTKAPTPDSEDPVRTSSSDRASPDATPPIPPERVTYINAGPGIDVLGVRWKGRINIGGSGNRGNSDTDNLHVDGEAVARRQESRYTINGSLDRSKDRSVVTSHNARLSGKYDRFMGPRWYGYALATAEEDRFRDIDLRTTLGAGLGHQLIENERTDLSLEGGLNHVRTDFSLAQDESYPALRWALKFDHRLLATDLQVFHSHEILTDLQRTERTFVHSQTGLRMPLLQRLVATAQLNVDFDNEPAPGTTKTDRTYLFTLGYHW